jgi:hypothetical protein
MNESQFLNMFRDAESYGFLSVPILVPPMIEEAFVEADTSSWGSASTAALWEISSVTRKDLFPPTSIASLYCILPSSRTQMPDK